MVDGTAISDVSVKDRLRALERYTQAWRTPKLIRDPELPIDSNQPYRYVVSTGDAIAVVQGSALKLVVPASPARGIRAQVWSIDFKGIPSEPFGCTTDISQSVFVLCLLKTQPK